MRSTSLHNIPRRDLRIFFLFAWVALFLGWTQADGEKGYRLEPDGIVVDRAEHWQAWTYPRHAVVIDSSTHEVHPRRVRKGINAVENLDRFRIKIGDDRAYAKLLRELKRENHPIPLNIRTGPAFAGSVPILHLKADPDKGIAVGDPVLWYFYHGGIRLAPNHPETAAHILDGDPRTYWEPSWVVRPETYEALAAADQGPIYYFVTATSGEEHRVPLLTYEQAPPAQRRIQYNSHSLQGWYVEVDLGRVVPVSRIVLRFVDAERGEPFRQFRLLSTPSQDRNTPLSLLARMDVPNVDQRVVVFDLDPEREGHYESIHRLRIVITDSQFDKYQKVSEQDYEKVPLNEQGGIDYYVRTTLGDEIKRDEETYYQVRPERQGRRVYYRRERPRLADIEVWSQGDNISLGVIEGGGSVSRVPTCMNTYCDPGQGFDGVYDTKYSQWVWWGSRSGYSREEYGLITFDLGAVFWIDHLRTLGCCCGLELAVNTSDGTRLASGKFQWEPASWYQQEPKPVGDISDFSRRFASPLKIRYLTTQATTGGTTSIFNMPEGCFTGKTGFTGTSTGEFQLFGEGFVSQILLTSPLIEVSVSTTLGAIEWGAYVPDPDSTHIEIRTRTGDQRIKETRYYTTNGDPVLESNYEMLPKSLQGPVVIEQIPGSGWSSWSPPYRRSGAEILSPDARRFLQIQVKLQSQSPELAPRIRSLRVSLESPVTKQTFAEIWPDQVSLGNKTTFEFYLNSLFVEHQPGGQVSTRFDELRLDASPMSEVELVDVGLGSEADFRQGTAQHFRVLGWHRISLSGGQDYWFEDEAGRRFQALIGSESGDTLRVYQGSITGTEPSAEGSVLHLHLPRKVATLPDFEGSRVYNRLILDEHDQVPVDEDDRPLNEILYLNLPTVQRGRILYFAITGWHPDGTTIQDSVGKGAYWGLPDSLRGEIRYFRTSIGGEFPFDRAGDPLTQAGYDALSAEERGAILSPGQLVRVRFKGSVVLYGTTLDASVRDAATQGMWQQVDPGDATFLTPSTPLTVTVPFSRQILHNLHIAPNPFTPNGDGINDQMEISFDLGKLNQVREIQVAIYDLSGRRVWREQREGYGSLVFVWDGRDAAGVRVPPGLYVGQVNVGVDADEATRTTVARVIAVAY